MPTCFAGQKPVHSLAYVFSIRFKLSNARFDSRISSGTVAGTVVLFRLPDWPPPDLTDQRQANVYSVDSALWHFKNAQILDQDRKVLKYIMPLV